MDARQVRRERHIDPNLAPRHVALRHGDRVADGVGKRDALDLQADRPDEVEDLEHDGVRHLCFFDDVFEDRLCVRRLGELAPQDPRHDFDARQRILDFVRDGGGHFSERGEAVLSRSRSSSCSTRVRSLKNKVAPVRRPRRSRTCDRVYPITFPVLFSRSSARFGRCERSNRPRHDSADVWPIAQNRRKRGPDVGGFLGEPQDAVGDLVHHRDTAIAGNRQHAIS